MSDIILGVSVETVSVKGKTSEGMGFGEGFPTLGVVFLQKGDAEK
jgi:2C-methyl-D-erythritol 2,4-cyclodiphosphate synthase